MTRILIVEDDIALGRGIQMGLKDLAEDFVICHSLSTGRQCLEKQRFSLMILDINLPDGSGLDFCREIRGRFTAPILFLTANDTELDEVGGLELGGDDYVTKPFSLAVLRARVGALLRRKGQGTSVEGRLLLGAYSFDFEAMQFFRAGQAVELSKTEQRLLHVLVANRGNTVPREKLLSYVWPHGRDFVEENALSVAVRRLREKLEPEPGKPRYIKTVYGIGYSWERGE